MNLCLRGNNIMKKTVIMGIGLGLRPIYNHSRDTLSIGSLFDGSGGFPLGGLLSGITPVWASEIEPFPSMIVIFKGNKED